MGTGEPDSDFYPLVEDALQDKQSIMEVRAFPWQH